MKTALFRVTFATALLAAGYIAGRLSPEPVAEAAQAGRVFEMRTYTTNEGKLPALQARFRDHTLGFFKKYDMTSIGYWVPADGPTSANHAGLHPGAPEPRSGQGELGKVQRGPGMAESCRGVPGRRKDSGQVA